MSEWQEVYLNEAFDIGSGLSKPAEDFGSGFPFLSFKEIFNNFFVPDELPELVESSEEERDKCSVKKGDVFLTRTSETVKELGMSCVALKDYKNATFNGFTKRLRPNGNFEIVPEYAGYYFRSSKFRNEVTALSSASTRASLNNEMLGRLKIVLPSKIEQENIAAILICLDRKIENLRKQNETLEAIAQTLFKHWFVDFEFPNEDGKPYKSSGGEMVRSELGKIPAGWGVAPFETTFLIPLRNGLTKPRSVRGSGFYMVNMGELFGNKRIGDLEMDRVELSDSEYEKSLLEVGDILFARQSLVREGAGQCSIITEAPEPRTFEGHLIRCRINRKKANPFYFFYHFWSFAGGFQMRSLVEQVAAAGIRGSELAKLEMLIPSVDLQNKFFTIIEPLEKSIALNFRRIRTLTKTRDVLLPKLMSGKLRITE
jgi:type I restriction enzyme S subunit